MNIWLGYFLCGVVLSLAGFWVAFKKDDSSQEKKH